MNAEQIIAIRRDLIATVAGDLQPVEVRAKRVVNMAHGPLVFALSTHSLRLGAVVVDLHEAGKGLEAMPTMRTLYESALTAQWLSQSREASAALVNKDLRQRRALSGEMARSATAVFREDAEKVAHINDEDLETIAEEQARHFHQLCNSLQPAGDHAYFVYRIMSSFAHPSSTLMDYYLRSDDSDAAGVVLLKDPEPFGHDSWLFLSVASMLWAARALDMMHRDAPHRSYLRGVAQRLKIPDVLHLTPEAEMAERRAAQARRRATWRGPKGRQRRGERHAD